jgi:phenylalanyl-tRNA synthetase beta chain
MLLDESSDVGARNERRCAVLYCGPSTGLEVLHGILDKIMQLCEVPCKPYTWETGAKDTYSERLMVRYTVEPTEAIPSFFPQRGAQIVLQHSDGSSRVLGSMGALHPEVLANFDIAFPTSILEINIEPLLF